MIRHGETDWNLRGLIQGRSDNPLNATGIAQASGVAAQIQSAPSGVDWAGVVTSPLVRAVKTGEIIANELGLPILESMSQLAERDYGAMEGVEVERARELHPAGDYPDSEHNDQVFERSLNAMNQLHTVHAGSGVVVVAHGGVIVTLLSMIHGTRVPSIQNSTLNLLEHDGERWIVRLVNGRELSDQPATACT